jgi:hypothetical protein
MMMRDLNGYIESSILVPIVVPIVVDKDQDNDRDDDSLELSYIRKLRPMNKEPSTKNKTTAAGAAPNTPLSPTETPW